MGKIYTVIGIDGSGKSTLIKKTGFAAFHFYAGVKNSSKKTIVKKNLNGTFCNNYIFKQIYSDFKFFVGTILKIYLRNIILFYWIKYFTKRSVVFDRYAYDYLSSFEKKKSNRVIYKILYSLFFYFPTPDKVVFLTVEPEVAFKRKKEFSIPYLDMRQKMLIRSTKHINSKKVFYFDSTNGIDEAYEIF